MNRPTIDFLSVTEKDGILSDLADLMGDTHVSVAVTYRDYLSVTRTPAKGNYTPTYTDYALRGVRVELKAREATGELSARDARAGAGLFEEGDLGFMFAQDDLPITPNREDRLVLGTETFEVISWKSDPLSATWNIAARRVKT